MRSTARRALVLYGACVGAVAVALAWMSVTALRLERRSLEQEVVRLALWRMDSALGPIIAAEAARPYFEYQPFYPAERAYTRMLAPIVPGEILVPSPLLIEPVPYCRLHFERRAGGPFRSPQAPTGNMLDLAESGDVRVEPTRIIAAHDLLARAAGMAEADRLTRVGAAGLALDGTAPESNAEESEQQVAFGKSQAEFRARQLVAEAAAGGRPVQTLDAGQSPRSSDPEPVPGAEPDDAADRALPDREAPEGRGDAVLDRVAAGETAEPGAAPGLGQSTSASTSQAQAPARHGAQPAVSVSKFEPAWRLEPGRQEPELFLFRHVDVAGQRIDQGVWLDWPALRGLLLSSAADLVPNATLIPLLEARAMPPGAMPWQRLATIPVALAPGRVPLPPSDAITPTRAALALTWAAAIAAAVAVGWMLRASQALADRRGRFVSAVTHELRTPLTTFCLYSQMLADGMVQDHGARSEYLGTLKSESRRLARIVESVLDYARLGDRRRPDRAPPADLLALLSRALPALDARARQSGMTLEPRLDAARGVLVAADAQTLERILLNLVDNACKYAAHAPDARIILSAHADRSHVALRVRDFGPGVHPGDARRLFDPFQRGSRAEHQATPGLGLGLALSQGLARSLGGDLSLARPDPGLPGAEFVLTLPTHQPPAGQA